MDHLNHWANSIHLGSEGPPLPATLHDREDDEAAGLHKLRILIVEDELFVAMHLETILEDLGYEAIRVVCDGESALQELRRDVPDIVFMDINLGPGIDGITAAQRLRATSEAHIIFVSAYNDVATRARIEAALPGSHVLSKPVSLSVLRAALEAGGQGRH